MKRKLAILLGGLVLAAGAAADNDTKTDFRKLQGTWAIVAVEAVGQKQPAAQGFPELAVIKGDRATFFAQGKEVPTLRDLRLRLDPKKTPKAVDLVREDKDSLPCIYELTGDDLKLAMPLVPEERKPGDSLLRPRSFDTKGKPVVVLVAKRSNR